MKKVFLAVLAMAIALSLVACGGQSSSSPSGSTPAPSSAPENTSGLSAPVNLAFAAQEVGTGAYSVAAAVQSAMLKGLPAGSTIDLTTNSPGGVGAPVLIQNEECDVIVANAGPSLWSYTMSPDKYEFGGCPDVASLAGGLGNAFTNVMFTQKFVDETGYTTLEEVIADKYPIKLITKKNGS